MPLTAISYRPDTNAEAFALRLTDLGASVFMAVPPDGRPFLTFEFSTFPPAPAACQLAALIRSRFLSEERFARDLFGHLDGLARVYSPRPARGFAIDYSAVSR